ncbi:MAG: hypothetical protein GY723_13265 [bacterium]|nr:hypothetical protein [bacterium]MCP5069937.1 hypothetical protein [bacterium]
MGTLELPPPQARRILELARTDRQAARQAMAEHSLDAQVALICETPVGRRNELLGLAAEPARLIPRLPPAELCFTAHAIGLADAGWLLEHATAEQVTTCVDLDAWHAGLPDRGRLGQWLEAFADGGDDTLLKASGAIDAEAWALLLMDQAQVILKPSGDDSWEPPAGGQTIDGQFYLVSRRGSDDLAELLDFLRVLFQQSYWLYFRLLQAVIWELPTETEEWARRWRIGRLEDLGFPRPDEAKGIYSFLGEESAGQIPEETRSFELEDWPMPVWMPNFPVHAEADYSLFRAFTHLPDAERRTRLLEFLSLANRVAVADDLPLGNAETLPKSLAKAARFASFGLDFVCTENALAAPDVLRRVTQDRLFRIGFNRERAAGRAEPPLHLEGEPTDDEDAEA